MENTNILTIEERDNLFGKIADLMIKRKSFDVAQERLIEQMKELLKERSEIFTYIRSKLQGHTDERSIHLLRAIDRAEIFIEQVFSTEGKLRHWDFLIPVLLAMDPTNTEQRTSELVGSINDIAFSDNPSQSEDLINQRFLFQMEYK